MNAVDVFAPLFDVASGLDDFAGGLDVALAAVGDQGCSTGCYDAAGPGTTNSGSGIDAAGPVWKCEPLLMPQFPIRIQNNRGSFRRKSVFMSIGRNTRDSGNRKIERFQGKSSIFHERNQKSAKTSVYMNRNIVFQSKLSNA